MTEDAKSTDRPLLRVVRGVPDDDELAALTAVVATMSGGGQERPAPRPARSRWADRAALVRRPLPFGRDAWRASGLPY